MIGHLKFFFIVQGFSIPGLDLGANEYLPYVNFDIDIDMLDPKKFRWIGGSEFNGARFEVAESISIFILHIVYNFDDFYQVPDLKWLQFNTLVSNFYFYSSRCL